MSDRRLINAVVERFDQALANADAAPLTRSDYVDALDEALNNIEAARNAAKEQLDRELEGEPESDESP